MTRKQRLVVAVGDATFETKIAFDSEGLARVEVAGRTYRVQDRGDGIHLVRPEDDHRVHAVAVDPSPAPAAAAAGGISVPVRVRAPHQAALEALAGAGAEGSGRIEAPMPGRIVRVLVEEGAKVERDAPCVIIEAMKMESELRAPVAGTVVRVAARVGTAVDAGALLCEIEATASS